MIIGDKKRVFWAGAEITLPSIEVWMAFLSSAAIRLLKELQAFTIPTGFPAPNSFSCSPNFWEQSIWLTRAFMLSEGLSFQLVVVVCLCSSFCQSPEEQSN
jgi:hypothetical protein